MSVQILSLHVCMVKTLCHGSELGFQRVTARRKRIRQTNPAVRLIPQSSGQYLLMERETLKSQTYNDGAFSSIFYRFTDELIRLRCSHHYISTELISSSALFNCIIRLIKCEWTSQSACHTAVSSPCWGGSGSISLLPVCALQNTEVRLLIATAGDTMTNRAMQKVRSSCRIFCRCLQRHLKECC